MDRCRVVMVAGALVAAVLATLSCGEVKEDADASVSPTIDASAIDASATVPDASAIPDASSAPDADLGECTAPEQCPGEDTDCEWRTCEDNTCGTANATEGVECNSGTWYCDGAGACVECLIDDSCAPEICRDHSCVPATCSDGEKNGDETDVDCGGSCGACANGRECGSASDCASGYCTGGVCTACTAHTHCADAGESFCDFDSGTCVPKLGQGLSCAEPAQCVSGSCADDRCCDTACTGLCEACDVAGRLGECTPFSSATDPDNECAGTGLCGGTCNGSGGCYYPPSSTQCDTCTSCNGSGFCAGYAAANTDPFDDCPSCYACNGGNVCAAVAGGADPLDECPTESPATCGHDGSCDGSGSCALWDDTTVCSAAACSSGVAEPADYCDGAGTCVDSGTVFCDGLACFGPACRVSCGSDTDCISGYFCDATSGTCHLTRDDGATCSTDSECTSGYCTDGVCCNARCNGTCEACIASLTDSVDGQCRDVTSGTNPGLECPGEAFCDAGACVCPCMKEDCVERGFDCGLLTCVSDDATCFSDERSCGTYEEPWAAWDQVWAPMALDAIVDLPTIDPLTGYCAKGVSTLGYPSGALILAGDGGYSVGVEFRYFGGLAFDLSSLPPGAKIVDATMYVYQSDTLNNVYTTPMNKIITEHVRAATLGDNCDAPIIEKGFTSRDLSTSATIGWKSATVTEAIRWDLATCMDRSQFRLQFAPQNGRNDSTHNRAELTSDNAPSENVPYLRVRYR